MKREFLKSLGIEDKDVIDKILTEHGNTLEGVKSAHKAELDTANATIKGLRADIKKFDGTDIEALKQSAKDWESKYNTDIAAERTKATNIVRKHNLIGSMKSAGVTDPEYLIYKHGGIEKFAFNDSNEVVGLEDTIKPYRESSPAIFEGSGDLKGPENNSSVVINTGNANDNGGANSSSTNAFMNGLIRDAAQKN